MEKQIKRIGVLTSGGDAPGMNAAIRAVVRSCMYHNIEAVGIRHGWSGLIHGDIVTMTNNIVSNILPRGGTILYTARCDEFRTKEGREKAYNTCKLLGLDAIVAIGGDGTFAGAHAFAAEYPISVVGIPATIDNDIGCTYYSLGYDTAANTAVEAIDKIRDTMQSHERCSVIEVMGHRAGNLALYVGLATGATAVLVPETPWDFEQDVAEPIRNARLAGRTHFMIVVAEGAKDNKNSFGDDAELGNGKAGDLVAGLIKQELGIDPRVTVLGHVQRGGRPSARDRVCATRMGYAAVEVLCSGKNNRVIVQNSNGTTDIDMEQALQMKNTLNPLEQEVLKTMTFSTRPSFE